MCTEKIKMSQDLHTSLSENPLIGCLIKIINLFVIIYNIQIVSIMNNNYY